MNEFKVWTADDMNRLKGKIDSEINRRNLGGVNKDWGSLGGLTNKEFSIPVQKEGKVEREHGEKTINFLYEICDLPMNWVIKGANIPTNTQFVELEEFVDRLATEEMTGKTTSCRGACTGLCYGSCISSCNSISGA